MVSIWFPFGLLLKYTQHLPPDGVVPLASARHAPTWGLGRLQENQQAALVEMCSRTLNSASSYSAFSFRASPTFTASSRLPGTVEASCEF